jgi:hypothetical protein
MMGLGRSVAVAARMLVAGLLLVACGGAPPLPSGPGGGAPAPEWEDAFDQGADLVAILRPQAMRRDPIYGPLLRRVSLLASARSGAVSATRSIETLETSEEVIIGLRFRSENAVIGETGKHGDVEIVMRGVSASIDPARVVDEAGHTVWRLAAEHRAQEASVVVDEYVHDAPEASLFVLPQRVWYVATGEARARARDAFEHPFGRPAMSRDDRALAVLRMSGPSLVKAVPRLRARGQLRDVGHHLAQVTFELFPGPDGAVAAALKYQDEDAAALAEMTVKRVVEVARRSPPQSWAWLGNAEVERADPAVVTVRAKLPEALLRALGAAADAPIDDRGWPDPD